MEKNQEKKGKKEFWRFKKSAKKLPPPSSSFQTTAQQIDTKSLSPQMVAHKNLQQSYQGRSTIQPLMGPPLALEDVWCNLSIVKQADQVVKEEELKRLSEQKKSSNKDEKRQKNLQEGWDPNQLMESFETLYRVKDLIPLQDLFTPRNNKPQKRLLILGRAGIGKSTLCQKIAYDWACGKLWPGKFQWLFWISLRHLRSSRYDPKKDYKLIDIIEKECMPVNVSPSHLKVIETALSTQWDQILWVLDGYDETVGLKQQAPHLFYFLEKLLADTTAHLILSSRPYTLNHLPFDVTLENMGFTDDNIARYIERFFSQTPDRAKTLQKFLKTNPSLKGIAHIPINLELMCSTWKDRVSQQSKQVDTTLTGLYDAIVALLLKRYVQKMDDDLPEEGWDVTKDSRCVSVRTFLERLAFHALRQGQVVIPGDLVKQVRDQVKKADPTLSLTQVVQAGFLTPPGVGRDPLMHEYYFLHLSFAEYFAGCYVAKHLSSESRFIRHHKYDPHYQLVFWFVSGRLKAQPMELNQFFGLLLDSPQDVSGIYAQGLLIRCLEECQLSDRLNVKASLLKQLKGWMTQLWQVTSELEEAWFYQLWPRLLQHCQLSPQVSQQLGLIDRLLKALKDQYEGVRQVACNALGELWPLVPREQVDRVVDLLLEVLSDDQNAWVREQACWALGHVGTQNFKLTGRVVDTLLNALSDHTDRNHYFYVPPAACRVLGLMITQRPKEQASWVVDALLRALSNQDNNVRSNVCEVLGQVGAQAPKQQISQIVDALFKAFSDDQDVWVRRRACSALGQMGTQVPVDALLKALSNQDDNVRSSVCVVLGQVGAQAPKQQISQIVDALFKALEATESYVRQMACEALGRIVAQISKEQVGWAVDLLLKACSDHKRCVRKETGKLLSQMVTQHPEQACRVVNTLLKASSDSNWRWIRQATCEVLSQMAQYSEQAGWAVDALIKALSDQDKWVREEACNMLRQFRIQNPEQADQAADAIIKALGDPVRRVRQIACDTLGWMMAQVSKEQAGRVIDALLKAFSDDQHVWIRRAACSALGQMGTQVPRLVSQVVDALLKGLGD